MNILSDKCRRDNRTAGSNGYIWVTYASYLILNYK